MHHETSVDRHSHHVGVRLLYHRGGPQPEIMGSVLVIILVIIFQFLNNAKRYTR